MRSRLIQVILLVPLFLAGIVFATPPSTTTSSGGQISQPVSAVTATSTGTPARPSETRLTIAYTNDTHSHLIPFNLTDFGKNIGGISRREAYFNQIRNEASNSLFLDAGDIFQGTAFYSFFKGEADMKAFSLCGYDCCALGNHDLDDGLGNLLNKLSYTSFPLVCSNVAFADSGKLVFPAFIELVRGNLRIAIIGGISQSAWDVISIKNRNGLKLLPEREAVAGAVAQVRNNSDLVILLSHSGYEEDLAIARQVDGVDIILGGHTNTFLEKPVQVKRSPTFVRKPTQSGLEGSLVLQAYKWGVYVGRLDLLFDSDNHVASFSGHLEIMDNHIRVASDSKVERLISAYDERIRSATSQVIGKAEEPLDYNENEKHKRDLPLGTFVCEALREFTDSDFSIVNSGSIRDSLEPGFITMGTVFSLFPFDNSVVSMKMKGKDIEQALTYICRNYGKITGYQFGGASFTMHLSEGKVDRISIADAALNPEKVYKVSTISYLSDGNQHGDILFKGAVEKTDNGFFVRDVIIEYIRKRGLVHAPSRNRIKIIP